MPLRRFLTALFIILSYYQAFANDDYAAIRLASDKPIKRLGEHIYPVYAEKAMIFTPGKKHIEIDKSTQTLRAYNENGRMFIESLVSTGEPGIDEEGWEKTETMPGFHKIVELLPYRKWSKDENIKMLFLDCTPETGHIRLEQPDRGFGFLSAFSRIHPAVYNRGMNASVFDYTHVL